MTRRCALRQFLLRPDDATNQTVLYCFALAAQRTNIGIVLPSVMSNHHHTTLWDPDGRYPEFTEHFHKLTARAMNALRRRHENFWASEPCSVVELADRERHTWVDGWWHVLVDLWLDDSVHIPDIRAARA